jgi:uncharacterized repeat protein (TIGR01451 family)
LYQKLTNNPIFVVFSPQINVFKTSEAIRMSENYGLLLNDDKDQSIVTSALELAKNQLYSFANSSDFQTKMQLAFGVAVDSNSFQIAWKNQDFSVIPNIEVRTGSELGGAIGAYAQATNTIYLSQDYLNQNAADIESITSVLLEEIGHAVDAKINILDAPGEEGAIFSGVVQGKTFEPEQIQQLKAEDDTAIIFLDGQLIQIEQAQPISKSGGVGGLTLPFQLDPLPQGQTEKSITVNYSYEHFSIPDQFEIRYGATPIFSTGGLVSNGKSGSKSFKQVSGNDQLTIKVTAPQSGTAWQFSVSTDAAAINVDGLLGDVIKIDLGKQKGNLALKSLPDASKGTLIDEKGENATVGTTYKVLYYVPKVTGAIQTYGRDRSGDLGLGQVTFDVEDQDQKSLTVKVSVTDGFSTTGSNTVKVEKGKLNVYTQQQRLAYLGFPGSGGSPLVVDGQSGGNTTWAKKLFNIAVRPEIASVRGRIAVQDDKSFKSFINSTNAPEWNLLRGAISNLGFPAESNESQRFYGTDLTGNFLQAGTSALNRSLKSTGVSQRSGIGNPSSTHDGGRSIDIDDIPDAYFFKSIGVGGASYVAARGGGFVVRDGNTYRVGNSANPLDVANGVRTNYIVSLPAGLTKAQKIAANAERKAAVTAIHNANLFVFSQTIAAVQTLLNAFPGTPRIFYNDPRFFGSGVIQYAFPHFDHIHFEIPIPQNSVSANRSLPLNSVPVSRSSLDLASPLFAVTNTVEVNAFLGSIDLGNLEDSKTLTGTISTTNTEQYYSFTIGSQQSEESYFTTPRDFNLLLNGLSGDVDVELFQDFSEDGIRQDGEVIASSTKSGNESEIINLTNLDEGVYYLRVFQKSGDTSFNLSLTVPPLPVPTDNAGNTVTNAKNLGIISNNVQQSDFSGQVDADDYYRFSLSSTNDLNVDVTGLSNGDLFAELGQDKNNDGILDFDEIIATSDEEGDASEKISRTGLAAGDYILHLGRSSGNTNYNLNLSATPSVIPSDKAGSTLATAFNLNTLTASTQSDFVGNVDPTDYYRFTLTNPSGVTLKLSGLSADADLELSQDKNGDGVISSDEVIQLSEEIDNQDENINKAALPAGDYFVKASQYDGDTNYSLELTPTTATGVDLQVTVTPVTTPLTLGEQVSYTVTVKNIGASNATGVTLNDNLPLESILDVSAVVSKGTRSISGNEITANIGSLNVNESATLVVSGRLVGSGSTSSLIQALSAEADFNLDNDSVVQRFNVAPGTIQPADLELSLTSDKNTANIDDIVTLRLTLTNKGNGAATSIKVKQVLAQGLTFVSSNPQQGIYDAVSGIWDVGNIARDNQAFIDVLAKVTSGGSLFNTAEIIAVAETDPDSTPNNNNPNEDDQASVTLNAALATPTLAKTADDIFTIAGGYGNKPKLQIALAESNSNLLNELAVFTVDDAQGKINGIAPGETGYTQAALNKSKVIFSTIANVPNGFNINNLTSLLEFSSGNNLRFLLVKNGTIDSIQNGITPTSDILFSDLSSQKITDLGTDGFSLAWKDGSNNNTDFKDLVVNIKSTDDSLSLGTNLQGKQQGEVLDLRGITNNVKANFTVNREAAFNNFVGFYKVADENGGIDVDGNGTVDFRPGDSGYAQAAIKNRVTGIDLRVNNQGTGTFTDKTLTGGSIFAPFILTDGRTVDQVLNGQVDQAYFAYLGANSDKVDHIRLLGNNVFGFEDLAGGGDKDYNDIIVKVNLIVV